MQTPEKKKRTKRCKNDKQKIFEEDGSSEEECGGRTKGKEYGARNKRKKKTGRGVRAQSKEMHMRADEQVSGIVISRTVILERKG